MIQAKVRGKYRSLSQPELVGKAGELAGKFVLYSWNCGQSNVCTIHEILEVDDCLVKVATSHAGVSVLRGLGTCGAVTGGSLLWVIYLVAHPITYLLQNLNKVILADNSLLSRSPCLL